MSLLVGASVGGSGVLLAAPDVPGLRAVIRLGAANAADWSCDLRHTTARIIPGAAHAMAIYFDVRDELLGVVGKAL